MSRKVEFAKTVRRRVTEFDDMVTKLEELDSIFTASGYESGGTDEITDTDIEELDVDATDLANFHTFVVQIGNFLDNGTPTQYDYRSALDAFREMP